MNTTGPHHPEDPAGLPLPAPLASGLRGLRVDAPPTRDLWPSIAARLEPRTDAIVVDAAASGRAAAPGPAAVAAATAPARRDRQRRFRRRNAGYAAAAAVVLAAGLGWQLWPGTSLPAPAPRDTVAVAPGTVADAPLLHAAEALAREYQGALREVQAATGTASSAAGLDAELERSAAEVRAALARDPDALHLFHRLQRIYAHRLALNLRQA